MKNTAKSLLVGFCGGLALYVVDIFYSTIPYINMPQFLFTFFNTVGIAAGIAISIFTILFQKPPFVQMILRFGTQLISWFGLIILNGYLGTIRYLYEALSLNSSSANDNVSGLMTLFLIGYVVISGLITLCVMAIVKLSARNLK